MSITPTLNHRGDPLWLPEVLQAFEVEVKELPGWKNWGMGDFNIIQGIVVHHTGSESTSAQYIARNGNLNGALSSQIHLSRTGVATLCGAGMAWHAGRGEKQGWPTNDANRVSIGIEAVSNGTSPWPAVQMDAYYRICAAILFKLGKRATTQTLIAHWEYSLRAQGKWDPGAGNGKSGALMDMEHFRARVNWYIDNPPWLAGKTQVEVSKQEEGKMIKHIADFITGYLAPVISDVKDVRQQLTGGRDAGQYPGWSQLGKDSQGRSLTLVDAVAALRLDVAAQSKRIDQVLEALQEGK
ncbi:N-acetylmuramoyl-L-alanine amidase [Corynebacterium kutscheri]|uniref:N-acetylmuramoyl-L-alanine amidase n=1 Tax=Corynebacterium kutscheri TaxID=35755 RepID=UPI0037BFB5D8